MGFAEFFDWTGIINLISINQVTSVTETQHDFREVRKEFHIYYVDDIQDSIM
jgi:hypothetical protein